MPTRLVSIAVSVVLLAVIYWRIDASSMVEALHRCDLARLGVAMLVLPLLVLLAALRFEMLLPRNASIGLFEANRMILAAWVLNFVLPSKAGDFAKALFVKDHSGIGGPGALAVVSLEKALEIVSLLSVCGFGLVLMPKQVAALAWLVPVLALGVPLLLVLLLAPSLTNRLLALLAARARGRIGIRVASLFEAWSRMLLRLRGTPLRFAAVLLLSLAISATTVVQAWLLAFALHAEIPITAAFGLVPLAMVAGFLPITFGGIGTRDAALIVLLNPYTDSSMAGAWGLLMTARYLVLALLGAPFVGSYLTRLRASEALDDSREASG